MKSLSYITSQSKKYLPNLDALRFFAASAVVFHHIELHKFRFGKDSLFQNQFWKHFVGQAGEMSVWFFFTLSGFLITKLLMEELQKTNKISVFHFYIRRSLRIWPLYFLISVLGLVVLPIVSPYLPLEPFIREGIAITQSDYYFWTIVIVYLTFSLHMFMNQLPAVWGSNQSWSIGAEEHFYLLWPWFLILFFNKIFVALFVVILIKIILNVFSGLVVEFLGPSFVFIKTWMHTWRIECMALGGIAAMSIESNILKKIILPIWGQVLLSAVILAFWFEKKIFGVSSSVILPVCYAIFIANAAYSPRFFLKLENRHLKDMGTISYGIYMFHPIVVYIVFGYLDHYWIFNWREYPFYYNLFAYVFIFGFTILVSSLSYRFMESWFLQLKSNYQSK